jgi:hypothetical protein
MTSADQPATAAPAPVEQDDLSLESLAQGVLDRSIRPRTGSVRRLAEGVLALQADLKKARKKGGKSGKKKHRKLAKIPGQKKAK